MPESHPRLQTLPYLHRNWRAGVDFLEAHAKMQLINGDEDHYSHGRLAKRPRYADSPDSGLGPDVDAFVLRKDPVETPNAMRVDVLKISHKDDGPRAKQTVFLDATQSVIDKDIVTTARCKITVATSSEILYCDSQICTIRTLLNAAGVCRMARVYLPNPFLIPEHKIFVTRQDDTTFDLADAYTVCVELRATDGDNWPPLDLTSSKLKDIVADAHTAPRHWSLAAEIPNALNRFRRSGVLKLHRGLASVCETDFVLDIDIRWTTSLPPKKTQTEQQHVYVGEIANAEPFDEPAVLANGNSNGNHVNGHFLNGHLPLGEDDMEEDAEGELTPSRSLRARGSKNYNLKELSAKSSGRQPRKRARITHIPNADSERVLYHLPKELVTAREFIKGAFPCCVCYATHQSLAQLRAHLLGHARFRFEVISTPGKQGHQIQVTCVSNKSGVYVRSELYSLGQPTKAFDLDKYVEGDESWVEDRLGPDNVADQETKEVVGTVPRKTSQTRAPRPVNKHAGRSKLLQQQQQQPKKKKVYVPETQTPLYDPLSKVELVPGTEAQQTFPDDTWLIQKHRETVQDFCDVASPEKEYIKEWDSFIQKKRIVSEAFIGRAVEEFVMEKVDWLLESSSRTLQFGKHLTVLVARGVEDDTVKLVQAKLREARNQRHSMVQTPATQPRTVLPKRNSNGCAVCGKIARGPSLLICANEAACTKPLYHKSCIRKTAHMSVDHPNWQCNNCAP